MLLAAEPGTISILIVLLVVAFMLAKRLTNPHLGIFRVLGAIVVVGVVFLFFVRAVSVRPRVQVFDRQAQMMAPQQAAEASARAQEKATRLMVESQQRAAEPMARSQNEAARSMARAMNNVRPAETRINAVVGPQPSFLSALGNAFVRVWTGGDARAISPAPPVSVAKKPKEPKPKEPVQPDPAAKPAWVDAAPKMQGDVYLMTLHIGPYTTEVECERDLPKALQGAVAEYADLLLGREQASTVQLPDEDLQLMLVRQRWLQTRPLEIINGTTQEMKTLHVQIGFDPAMQQRIRSVAERAADYSLVGERMKVSSLVLSGTLALLALIWVVLGVVVKRPAANETPEKAASAGSKGHWSHFLLFGGLLAAVVLVILLLRIAA